MLVLNVLHSSEDKESAHQNEHLMIPSERASRKNVRTGNRTEVGRKNVRTDRLTKKRENKESAQHCAALLVPKLLTRVVSVRQ